MRWFLCFVTICVSLSIQAQPKTKTVIRPSFPTLRHLAGKSRLMIEQSKEWGDLPVRLLRDGAWVQYGDRVMIRYENGYAVHLRMKVPAGLSCAEILRHTGFKRKPSIDGERQCDWPGSIPRSKLGKRLFAFVTRNIFDLRLQIRKR